LKRLFSLIGPPAVGKTTWTRESELAAIVVNRDEVVEQVAAKYGMTYDEAFVAPPQDAALGSTIAGQEKFGRVVPSDLAWRQVDFSIPKTIHQEVKEELDQRLTKYAKGNDDVILDMTNMDVANRSLYMRHFGDDFHKIAVLFDFQGERVVAAIKKRAAERQETLKTQGRSKSIPPEVIDRMIAQYEPPSQKEGFNEILAHDILAVRLKNPRWNISQFLR